MAGLTRRAALRSVAAPAILRGSFRLFAQSRGAYSARAIHVLERTPVVDLLNQLRFPDYADKPPKIERWLRNPDTFTAADAAVYQTSGINVFALGDAAGDYYEGLKFY